MGKGSRVFVERHVPVGALRSLISREKDKRVHERLLFIHQLYMGASVPDACERLCIALQTGHNWLKAWNQGGYAGLKPRFGGGRPPKLTPAQRETLREALGSKDHWLTGEVRDLIARRFSVQYSMRQVARILRSLGMHYSKPYPKDIRRPEDAEEVLRERLDEALKRAGETSCWGSWMSPAPRPLITGRGSGASGRRRSPGTLPGSG